ARKGMLTQSCGGEARFMPIAMVPGGDAVRPITSEAKGASAVEVVLRNGRVLRLQIRHSSLYAPRDFDISPYFQIVKPTLMENFNYKFMDWADLPAPPAISSKPNIPHNDQGCASAAAGEFKVRRTVSPTH